MKGLGIVTNVDITKMTSFKIGCICKYFVEITSVSHLKKIMKYCKHNNIKYFVLGNGTNVLIGNKFYDGIVIKFGNKFANFKIKKNIIECESGLNMFALNRLACNNGLSGLEFSYGIPGTIGGGVVTNIGAFGGELKDVLKTITVLENGKIKTYKVDECGFGYRDSIFLTNKAIILKVTINLKFSDKASISSKMEQNITKRHAMQPYASYSAGSVFKRKPNVVVSKWIDEAGLKGKRIGDACVSNIHAGFIVNDGKATCQDVINLIEYINNLFYQEFNENLELEIKLINI